LAGEKTLTMFDFERITMSKSAHPLGIPDALLGLASFSATLTLAILARRHKTARILLDASAEAFNANRQLLSLGKLRSWCTGTAISAGVMAYAGRDAIHDTCSEAAAIGRKIGIASSACEIVQFFPIQARVDCANTILRK
jgi:hypothetical protein